MIISNFAESVPPEGGRRIEAEVRFESSSRSPEVVWFESPSANVPLDPNIFLIGTYPIAAHYGESRILVEAPTSALLRDKLADVSAWWRKWGFADVSPVIEGPIASCEPIGTPPESLAMLSGGIDSLNMIYSNHDRFAPGHPHRIGRGMIVYGFSRLPSESMQTVLTPAVQRVANDTGIELLLLFTNLRTLEGDLQFWRKLFHGAFLAACGHAATAGSGVVRVASSFDIANMTPWGSHPLIEPNFSTERLEIIHEGIASSRLDKVRYLRKHPLAVENAQVCTKWLGTEGNLNCGRCEKCVRTKLELLVSDIPIPNTFANRGTSPEQLWPIDNAYQASCYRDLVQPLKDCGEKVLARAVQRRLTAWPLKHRVRQARLDLLRKVKR